MFDFDAGKLLIIGVIALIVIGPKELPRVLRQVGQTVGRLRRMATEFQGQFMDAMKEADIESIRQEVDKLSRESSLDVNFDPARDIQAELTRTIDKPAPAEVPALAAAETASPTADFALPHAEGAGPEGETETLAAAGLAPMVEDAALVETAAVVPGLESAVVDDHLQQPGQPMAAVRKRIIILPRRRPLRQRAPHDVSDRTRARAAKSLRLKAMEP